MLSLKNWAMAGAVLLAGAGVAHADGGPDGAGPMAGDGMDRPAYARPGQCFEKVRTAEVWDTVPERQMVAPERIERRLIPAEFEWRDRTVVVRPARVEHYPVPPTFRTVTETVVVRPPSVRVEVIPPVYEPVARQVLVREARTVWKPGYAQPQYGQSYYAPQGYGSGWRGQTQVTPTGEIMCLVVEPAIYRTVVEQVLRVPERRVEIQIPPETRLVSRQVIDRPGYDAAREIPAELSTVREKVVVRPEHEESYTVPPVFRTVESRRLVRPSRTDWREIACAAPPPPPPRPMPPPCGERCAPPPPPRVWTRPAPPPVERPMARAPRVHHRYFARPAEPCNVCAQPAPPMAAAPPPERTAPERMAPPPRMSEREHSRMMGRDADQATPGRPMVARLQGALATRGYYKGPIDGVYTSPTRDALVRFQTEKGLANGGELTRETARELRLGR